MCGGEVGVRGGVHGGDVIGGVLGRERCVVYGISAFDETFLRAVLRRVQRRYETDCFWCCSVTTLLF